MTDGQDQRQFSRIIFDAPTRVAQLGQQWQAKLIDLSLKGILIEDHPDHPIEAGHSVSVTVILETGIPITMDGHLAHCENSRCGIRCDHIDLDSITHLRRLVELNLGDEELLERELGRLG